MIGKLQLKDEYGNFVFITEDNQEFEIIPNDTLDYFVEYMAKSQKMSKTMSDLPVKFIDFLFKNHYKLIGFNNVRNIKTNKVVSIEDLFEKYWSEFVEDKLSSDYDK